MSLKKTRESPFDLTEKEMDDMKKKELNHKATLRLQKRDDEIK